jgi:hypothetical protein
MPSLRLISLLAQEILRFILFKNRHGTNVVTDTCNPSTGEAEAKGARIQCQPDL